MEKYLKKVVYLKNDTFEIKRLDLFSIALEYFTYTLKDKKYEIKIKDLINSVNENESYSLDLKKEYYVIKRYYDALLQKKIILISDKTIKDFIDFTNKFPITKEKKFENVNLRFAWFNLFCYLYNQDFDILKFEEAYNYKYYKEAIINKE